MHYDHQKIEKKWQRYWQDNKIFEISDKSKKQKFYVLDMFPYPSGVGLHVGHPKGYIATDIISRAKRMQGYEVLHPMGWDAFGLPAENYAIKSKIHPAYAVQENIETFKKQLSIIGLDYDWSREINTTDPNYYKWTQWIFLQLFKKGLAYQSSEPINWCPSCKTGLANEDLEQGVCEQCGSEVEQRPIRQWVLKITDYADRLLEGLDKLDWGDSIKEMQRNWIGKSDGAIIKFLVVIASEAKQSRDRHVASAPRDDDFVIEVFTTRPDTLFGATYMVLAPEHPLIQNYKLQITNYKEVSKYVEKAKKKTELERQEEKEKTGIELKGLKAVNPATQEEIPVWIADYVLASYGTGAIMAVPAHDERDWEFAKKYNLPIKEVVAPKFEDEGSKRQQDKPTVVRKTLYALLRNPRNDTYLGLDWKNYYWNTLIIGGVEDNDPIVSAQKEIEQETGYTKTRFVKSLGRQIGHYYAAHKNENRIADAEGMLFDLVSEDQIEVKPEELAKHTPQWLTREEIGKFLNISSQRYLWERYLSDKPFVGEGVAINSGEFDGLTTQEFKEKITKWLEKNNLGKKSITYRLRDWVFSRQRYWGEPIPLIHCAKCGVVPVPEKNLPVKLPEVESYEPTGTGESPLASIDEWVNVSCPSCGGEAKRETNTMPQWAGSCWYYLRYIDPKNNKQLVDMKKEKYWSPIDLYVGGAEHATRHLIYARFWHKFLYDIGAVNYDEPFQKLQQVGLILAADGRKMSKRWGNVINPDEIVEVYGADTLRLYEMFMGPFSQAIAWDPQSIVGVRKFLDRLWRFSDKVEKNHKESADVVKVLHQTIKKVTLDIEQMRFNTAIAQMMILSKILDKQDKISPSVFENFILILSPFAPHLCEELWAKLGHKESLAFEPWPSFDEALAQEEEIELVIQVNGKVRAKLKVAAGISEAEAKRLAMNSEKIKPYLETKPKKIIFVRHRLINIVV